MEERQLNERTSTAHLQKAMHCGNSSNTSNINNNEGRRGQLAVWFFPQAGAAINSHSVGRQTLRAASGSYKGGTGGKIFSISSHL